MEKITNIEEFRTKANDLMVRMRVIKELFTEANDLVRAVDVDAMIAENGSYYDGDIEFELEDLANDIAYFGGYIYDGVGEQGGFWLPSTC